MKNQFKYGCSLLIFGGLVFFGACRKDLPLTERPEVVIIASKVEKVNTIALEAELLGNLNDFKIKDRFFDVRKLELQSENKKVKGLIGNRPNKFNALIEGLNVSTIYTLKACITLLDTFRNSNSELLICSDALDIQTKGLELQSRIIFDRVNNLIEISSAIFGLEDLASIEDYGNVWTIDDPKLSHS